MFSRVGWVGGGGDGWSDSRLLSSNSFTLLCVVFVFQMKSLVPLGRMGEAAGQWRRMFNITLICSHRRTLFSFHNYLERNGWWSSKLKQFFMWIFLIASTTAKKIFLVDKKHFTILFVHFLSCTVKLREGIWILPALHVTCSCPFVLLSSRCPPEVADVCAFLASDDSRYVTGASIEVTGRAASVFFRK